MKFVFIFISIFIIIAYSSKSQELKIIVPVYSNIEKAVSDNNSKYFYPQLFDRYNRGDSTLSLEDYHNLYYGYVFNTAYKSDASNSGIDSLFNALKLKEHKQDDIKRIISIANRELADNPFELRLLNILYYAYTQDGDKDSLIVISRKLKGIFDAITNSGTGKSCEDPMYVIEFSDAHEIVEMIDIIMKGHQITGSCDRISLGPNPYNLSALYFDVAKPIEKQGNEGLKKAQKGN